ncbi:MAG: NAD(P)-dependent glycerol-3-phosphate dehydrogenase [Planctomycetota bacterium]|nr:NAD(P)-dependent glycerol-3-phosphate dehydrogenase [Planctomycetota bacterium]
MRIGVIGDGGWGTALSMLLIWKNYDVLLWGAFPDYIEAMRKEGENFKYLPGVCLPEKLLLSSDFKDLSGGFDILVSAVPTQFVRAVFERFKPYYKNRVPIVSVSKGLEEKSHKRCTEIIRDVLGEVPLAVLSGPSHAEEVARKIPTAVSVASQDAKLAEFVQEVFATDEFRPYTNPDPIGVELGGALKNVIALAAGMCDGLGFGDNTKSALLARGLAEMIRIGTKLGAQKVTFFGLSGVGDLTTTSFSKHGRNREVGERIGRGERLDQILASMEKVAEGVWTSRSVVELSKKLSVDTPISRKVYQILFENESPRDAVLSLMHRPLKSEYSDFL